MAKKPPDGKTVAHQHIIFHTQYIKDLSFENPQAPAPIAAPKAAQPQITINCSVTSRPIKDKTRHYEISLTLAATAKQNDAVLFIAELTYGGEMSLAADIDEKNIHPLVMIEGPRHLFPFARMLLNTIVREGGFLPLNIQPIDFVRLYQQRMQHMQTQKSAGEKPKGNGKG